MDGLISTKQISTICQRLAAADNLVGGSCRCRKFSDRRGGSARLPVRVAVPLAIRILKPTASSMGSDKTRLATAHYSNVFPEQSNWVHSTRGKSPRL